MATDRTWMNSHRQNGTVPANFIAGVEQFVEFALSQPDIVDQIKCPCRKCRNRFEFRPDIVRLHLYRHGFMHGYTNWTAHGEPWPVRSYGFGESSSGFGGSSSSQCNNNLRTMVVDAMGPEIYSQIASEDRDEPCEQEPNASAKDFFRLLEEADKPLWSGCVKQTRLSAMSQLLNCKSEYNMPAECYDRLMSIVKEMLPEDNALESTFYKTKQMLSTLGLGYVKIDACVNDCMLYYKETENMTHCPTCKQPRYKQSNSGTRRNIARKILRYLPLTPRIQRLYMSRKTSHNMVWHAENAFTHGGVMSHPVHREAWKHFDRTYPQFSLEPQNVRIGLCTDGFNPLNMTSSHYSCWPVMITVYNLPPGLYMKQENLFLSMVIPGPQSPGKNIDVYLRPLIDELKMLWDEGVETYDAHRRQNFRMRVSLIWTISDFPGYGMLSGWSTHGKLACPYCMGNTKSFRLKYGKKISFFDCHRQFLPCDHPFRSQRYKFRRGREENDVSQERPTGEYSRDIVDRLPTFISGKKVQRARVVGFGCEHNWVRRSIFWELPYWHTNLIRHNLDVMHIEKNVFDNIFFTVMDVKEKSKDKFQTRKDLEVYCHRPELHVVEDDGRFSMPKASYSLTKEQKILVCNWIKRLRMPDGYASNIANCIKGDSDFYGMKSHDCHIFMQRLMPIAFKEFLPKPIWEALTELSHFFRDICSTVLKVEDMERLEKSIVTTICKLEKIFPPAFFDSMEHLPIHLPYEARVGGPVQYRWMYPFERFLNHLKRKVKNRACVEGSIVEAYLIEKTSMFCSLYFDGAIETRLNRPPRNDDGGLVDPAGRLSIFTHPGRPIGKRTRFKRDLTDNEYLAASRYVLLNCTEITPFLEEFQRQMTVANPHVSDAQMDCLRDERFASWLQEYVRHFDDMVIDSRIRQLANGPSRTIKCSGGYFVNGFKFHTLEYGKYKKTMNSGVCVMGSSYNDYERDYYGVLVEILDLEYFGKGNIITLFKCDWIDNDRGVRVDPQFNLVEVNHKKKLHSSDVFILASQAQQVYFTSLPSTKRNQRDWWVVVKTKARNRAQVEGVISGNDECNISVEIALQEDPGPSNPHRYGLSLELDEQLLLHEDLQAEEVDAVEVMNYINSDEERVMEDEHDDDSESDEGDTEDDEIEGNASYEDYETEDEDYNEVS